VNVAIRGKSAAPRGKARDCNRLPVTPRASARNTVNGAKIGQVGAFLRRVEPSMPRAAAGEPARD
jgi:hypothetical protein